MGFVASSSKALLTTERTHWVPTMDAFFRFLKTTGIDLELQSLLNARLLDNIIILGRVQTEALLLEKDDRDIQQQRRDRRDDALLDTSNSKATTATTLPTKEEALRYVRTYYRLNVSSSRVFSKANRKWGLKLRRELRSSLLMRLPWMTTHN
jgi:hypothetical protein